MMNELVAARPRVVVLLSSGVEQPLKRFLLILWKQENFRSLIVLLSSANGDAELIDNGSRNPNAASAVDHCRAPLEECVSASG